MNVFKLFTMAATFSSLLVSPGFVQSQETKAIDWDGSVFHAYTLAKEQNKPLIVYFHKDYCDECRGRCLHCAPVDEMLKLPEVVTLAEQAIWVWQTLGVDDEHGNVKRLMDQLEVDRVPAIYVLAASDQALTLRGKIVGVAPVKLFVKQLRSYLENGPSNSAIEKAETVGQDTGVGSSLGAQSSEQTVRKAGFFESLVNQNFQLEPR